MKGVILLQQSDIMEVVYISKWSTVKNKKQKLEKDLESPLIFIFLKRKQNKK